MKIDSERLKSQERFFYECALIDSKQYGLFEVWDNIHVGTTLYLTRDLDIQKSNTVAVVYKMIKIIILLDICQRAKKATILPIF